VKEKKKIARILATFHLNKPIQTEIRDRILEAKKRSFNAIIASECGGTSIIEMEKYSLSESPYHERGIGGIMKKIAVVGGLVAVIALVAGVYLYQNQPEKSVLAIKGETKDAAVVTFILGDVTVKRGSSEPEKLSMGEKIGINDEIVTGDSSNVTLQIDETGIVRILEKSKFTFTALKTNGATEIALAQGSVFSKVIKINKNDSYKVKTPLCIAAVRGTEFLTSYDSNKSEVQVLGGKVAVDSLDEKIEKIADGENGVSVDSDGIKFKEYKLNKVQTATLEKYALADYIENLDDKSTDELKTIGESVIEKEKALNDTIKKLMEESRLNPLDKLRSLGKPLTMLYLRDGSQLAGSVISANDKTLKLDTGDGVIIVPTEEVRRRMMIK